MARTPRSTPSTALLLLACAAGAPHLARAAGVTEVADAADGDNVIDFNIGVSYRAQARLGTIARDEQDTTTQVSSFRSKPELSYQRFTQVADVAATLGLFHDLEVHLNIPYALADDQRWSAAQGSAGTLLSNTFDADGAVDPAGTPRPIVPGSGHVSRMGLGDMTVGLAWGIVNGERDEKPPKELFPFKPRKATWVVGLDYTLPTGAVMNPQDALSRTNGEPIPAIGQGLQVFDAWMAMSKRVGKVDPFMRLHYTIPIAGDNAYDNCQGAGQPGLMTSIGRQICQSEEPYKSNAWVQEKRTRIQAPQRGGLQVGAEFVPWSNDEGTDRFAVALQAGADYVAKGRTYTEVADMLGKLTTSEQHFAVDGRLTMDLRLGGYFRWITSASVGTVTAHALTAESPGDSKLGADQNGVVDQNTVEQNPNYDFRIDQAGRRLRLEDAVNIGLSTQLAVTF